MDLHLAGKRAIVTGGSRGIGKQIARVLLEEGALVAIVARDDRQLAATAAEFGACAFPLQCDTGSDEAVKSMVAAAVAWLGGVDVLVNCAAEPGGQAVPPQLAGLSGEALWKDLNVKVLGYLRCVREAVPYMEPGSRIVNVSGLAVRSTGSTIGSIRNAGVVAMTKNLADELGPRGISITVVHPGVVRTERFAAVVRARAAASNISEEEVLAAMARRNVLNRIIDAAEVADVVAFLCSPNAIGINGDAVVVGGGAPGAIYY